MKRLAAGVAACSLLVASLGLQACHQHAPAPDREAVKAHHMSNGRYAFQDSNGYWWWYVYNTQATGSLSSPGGWARGSAPSVVDLESEIDTPAITIAINESGTPSEVLSEASVQTAAPAEAGGGTSASYAAPTESSPSVPAEASADAGGGGDAGGGSE